MGMWTRPKRGAREKEKRRSRLVSNRVSVNRGALQNRDPGTKMARPSSLHPKPGQFLKGLQLEAVPWGTAQLLGEGKSEWGTSGTLSYLKEGR